MSLLTDLFSQAGHRVHRVDWRVPRIARCDVVVFLELFNPNLLKFADRSVGIFNPEWFLAQWKPWVGKLTQVWAKSASAVDIFTPMNPRTFYTGFLTRDLYEQSVQRKVKVLHMQGHSQDKNTERVLEAWSTFPGLPPLTVLSHTVSAVPRGVVRLSRVPEHQLRVLLNEHDIHLCPSKVEGWGHYITEALSTGAYTITTDMSPMNEHVRPEWGSLIPPSRLEARGFTQACDVEARALAEAVRSAVLIEPAERTQMRYAARAHMNRRNSDFATAALNLLEQQE
jgi:hypothetical protein